MLYTLSDRISLAGWVRHAAAGEPTSKVNDDDQFVLDLDIDVLAGIEGRFFFTRRIALQAGYEAGSTSTINVGVRFNF